MQYLPDGGIRIFADLLHTHLAGKCLEDHNYKLLINSLCTHNTGRALELQHLRWNSECGVYEELPPIDLNLNYDFNFQEFAHLPKEITVLPVSIYLNFGYNY